MKPDPKKSMQPNRIREDMLSAIQDALKPRSSFLRQYIQEQNLMAPLLAEATWPWKPGHKNLRQLADDGLLNRRLIDAMQNAKNEYRMPDDLTPYAHQLQSIEKLVKPSEEPKSAIISSGTGSGKTECFLWPVLSDLYDQMDSPKGLEDGVQVLMLYPLNALIGNQKERLKTWCSSGGRAIPFALYNGLLPNKIKSDRAQQEYPQIMSRDDLRKNPPPILVTNATMLQYMLLRNADTPILQKSRGKLKTIILDEVHTYLGSRATDLSLLIRRALLAFEVEPSQVRFIATSATLGDPKDLESTREQMSRFLSSISGIKQDRIEVIFGERQKPVLKDFNLNALEQNEASILNELVDKPASKLQDVADLITLQQKASEQELALPVRLHLFHKSFPTLFACPNPNCEEAPVASDWGFGKIHDKPGTRCHSCRFPLFAVAICRQCGQHSLQAVHRKGEQQLLPSFEDIDSIGSHDHLTLLIPNRSEGAQPFIEEGHLDCHGHYLDPSDETIPIRFLQEETRKTLRCPHCLNDRGNSQRPIFQTTELRNWKLLHEFVATLLKQVPPETESQGLPLEGRRILTFTDSRQRTAITSTRLSQLSERTNVRSLIYHCVLDATNNASRNKEIKELQQEIATLEATNLSSVQGIIQKKQSELQQLQMTRLSFEEVKRHFRRDGCIEKLTRLYRDIDPTLFSNNHDRTVEFVLLKEFIRRPIGQHNLESLGLIRVVYPDIDSIQDVPRGFEQINLKTYQSWLNYFLNWGIRGNGCVIVESAYHPWMDTPQNFQKIVLDPNPQASSKLNNTVHFHVNRRGGSVNRVTRLAARLLELNPTEDKEADRLDQFLYQSLLDLKKYRILKADLETTGQTLLRLQPDAMAFELVQQPSVCSITGRLVEFAVNDISPFAPETGTVQPLSTPWPVFPWPQCVSENGAALNDEEKEDWIQNNPHIQKLKQAGHWTLEHDRILKLYPWFRSEEHSAQRNPIRLSHLEGEFKNKQINVLNCSTTMEMGVDIGGLNTTAMANVPPTPANYMQRAGRAGRRGELLSRAATLIAENPHDENVFQKPEWIFKPNPIPAISFQSEKILRRHVNALLLEKFIRTLQVSDRLRMTCEDFFASEEDYFGQFRAKLKTRFATKEIDLFYAGLNQSKSANPNGLRQNCLEQLEQIHRDWQTRVEIIEREKALVPEKEKAYINSLKYRKKRLMEEHLLGWLVEQCFLPALGFPTNVVELATPDKITAVKKFLQSPTENVAPLARQEAEQAKMEDRLAGSRRANPSRELKTALREYAPEGEVVIANQKLRSDGLSLTWHQPASDTTREPQKLATLSTCEICSSFWTDERKSCPNCQSKERETLRFVKPSGFVVAHDYRPNNFVGSRKTVPMPEPRFSAGSEKDMVPVKSVPGIELNTYTDGRIFYTQSGQHKKGYQLCLKCGRAKSMDETSDLKWAQEHPDLRFHRTCQPGTYEVQTNIHLGFEETTDVAFIKLKGTDTNKTLLRTLGAALRLAFTREMGILPQELSTGIHSTAQNEAFIVLFDTASSGAGYSSQLDLYWTSVLQSALGILQDCDCDKACHNCILDFETRLYWDEIDRNITIKNPIISQLQQNLSETLC